ncbi:tetratricopeptide repeat protein [Acidianus manzaensis]|uniref:tetratricopeptide repeat protein n=1 Tax=Acidianus manzaensis TaxID=282676 RepID=UPI001F396284|nr:tetratricopeptide repeat protein [Acidianus manzaensis]
MTIDEEEKAYKLYEDYKKTKNKKNLEEIIKLLSSKKDINSLNLLSLAYINLEKYDQAIELLDEAIKKTKDEEDKSILLFNKALALKSKGNLTASYQTLKQISPKSSIYQHSRRFLAQICISFGDLHYLEEAKEILENFEIPNEDLIITYILLSRLKYKELYKKAVKLAKDLKNEKLLAEALLSSDDEEELQQALQIFRKLKDTTGEAKALYKLSLKNPSLLYEAVQKLEESGNKETKETQILLYQLYKNTGIIDFLKQSIKIAEKYEDYLFLARSYVELSKKENEIENLRKAVNYYEKYISK